ncbi:MAG TPA: ABC transporter substrate-binding protein [Acidimicrobiales bacterium]|nr:ABC transporter substrate-binding protein [Acidimicrobiales bacterium]
MNLLSLLRAHRAPAVAVVVLALAAAGCGGRSQPASAPPGPDSTTPGPAKLRVSFVPATTALPLHVAKEKGIFERNNLDVTLEQAANISDIPATLGRQFDIALGTATDLIRAGSAGLDVVQVAGNTISSKENPFVQVIVPADSGITDVAQLKDKTVGSPTLSGVIHAGVLWAAKQRGVNPDAIRGVEAPSPNLPDQLKAGRLDAVEALEPFATNLKRDGYVSIGDPFSAIADPLATNFWMAQGSWARQNRPAIDRFIQSLREAQAFIEQNNADARQVLQGYTGMPAPVANSVALPTYSFDVRTQDLARWVQVLKDLGEPAGNVDPAKLVLPASGR